MQDSQQKFTTPEFCKLLGIDKNKLNRFIQEGLPKENVKALGHRGRPPNLFDADLSARWFSARGMNGFAKILRKHVSARSSGKKINIKNAGADELYKLLDEIKKAERVAKKQWDTAIKNDEPAMIKSTQEKDWLALVRTRVDIEKALPEILLQQGKVKSVPEITQDLTRIMTIFKNEIMGLGAMCRLDITPYLGDQTDAGIVENLIQDRARNYLQSCSDKVGAL